MMLKIVEAHTEEPLHSSMHFSRLCSTFFSQCGLLLGTVLLMCSAGLTHFSCNLLMKGAVSARRRSYEFLGKSILLSHFSSRWVTQHYVQWLNFFHLCVPLAYHAFGHVGKLAVELRFVESLINSAEFNSLHADSLSLKFHFLGPHLLHASFFPSCLLLVACLSFWWLISHYQANQHSCILIL